MVAARRLSRPGERLRSARATLDRKASSAPWRLRRRQRELSTWAAQWRDRVDPRWRRPSARPLRVVMPVGPKDLDVVATSVAALRRNLLDDVRSVTLVAADAIAADLDATALGVDLVTDSDLVGATTLDMVRDRGWGGWMIQQIVKLSCDGLADDLPILALDADTVLVAPQAFREGDRVARLVMPLNMDGYHRHLDRVFAGTVPLGPLGYVAHQMVFEPEVLVAMRSRIEGLHGGADWREVLLGAVSADGREGTAMSEFELYGHFTHRNRVRPLVHRAWRNRGLDRAQLAELPELEERWGAECRSVSFHYHLDTRTTAAQATAGVAR